MKFALTAMVLFFSLSAFAKKGPMPQERTDTPKLGQATIGRYMYLGDAPKFEGTELEITISKMNLTARVTAHVNQNRIDTYANQLSCAGKASTMPYRSHGFSSSTCTPLQAC